MKVGVLALQGAFAEMASMFRSSGHSVVEIRQLKDVDKDFDMLAFPGGESTTQGKLLKELKLFDPLKEMILNDTLVFATCAGLILLAERLEGDPTKWFGVLPVSVKRNAYGRQLGSFTTISTWNNIENVPMTFIRAPQITSVSDGVEVLSTFNEAPTSVRWKNITAFTWHPELTKTHKFCN